MKSLWLDTHPIQAAGAPLTGGERYDTVVVGAGLTGLATAVLLARSGQSVGVLEDRGVGAVTTGNTTAKLSLLQGTQLTQVRNHSGDEVLGAYVAGNLAASAWLLEFLSGRGVPVQRRTAFTYANAGKALRDLEAELDAATSAGLPVAWAEDTGLPYEVAGAIELADQAQFHPLEVLDALLAELLVLGGALHSGERFVGIRQAEDGCSVRTLAGRTLHADRVVLATGVPVLDRGAHFARLQPLRSYALAFRVPGDLPSGMYLSVDAPSRSLRTVPLADSELLLVGGNGHPVGRGDSPKARVSDLEEWTGAHFAGAVRTHAWSAQDYRPTAGLPLVGELPFSRGRVLVATGYNKWGMTNAVAAALRLAASVTGETNDWHQVLAKGSGALADALDTAKLNVEIAGGMSGGWLAAEVRSLPKQPPAEGSGVVGRLGVRPAARSTVSGRTCTVSAMCTHLGGILNWNDAETSWDCPLHGSRFDADGRRLEGPAVEDLEVLD